MTNEQTYSVPVPYTIYSRAGRRIDDMENPPEFWSLAEKMDNAWMRRKSTKGRPPVVQLTEVEIRHLADFAYDMLDFDHDDDPAVINCAKKFWAKYAAWHRNGTPFTGQSKSRPARNEVPQAFRDHAEWVIKKTIDECEAVMVDEFGSAPNRESMILKVSYSQGRKRSWGGSHSGRPFMSLAIRRFVRYWYHKQHTVFGEYKSFCRDPEIGTIGTVDWRLAVRTLVAHEYAHAVQHDYMGKYTGLGRLNGKGHKDRFKMIYRVLRRKVINPRAAEDGAAIGEKYYRREAERKKAQREGIEQLTERLHGMRVAASSKE